MTSLTIYLFCVSFFWYLFKKLYLEHNNCPTVDRVLWRRSFPETPDKRVGFSPLLTYAEVAAQLAGYNGAARVISRSGPEVLADLPGHGWTPGFAAEEERKI